jgi:SAM-dependent methyltransferase
MVKGARNAPAAQWVVGDGMLIPLPDASLDYIMNIGSLEHYDNPVQGMREIARLLKPNGRACILLPNAFGLWGNIKRVWQTGEIFDDAQPLQRYATRNTWETTLRTGGLTVERLVPWNETNFPRTARDLWWMMLNPQKIVRAGLAALLPANLANHFVFICCKASTLPEQSYYPMWPAP